MKNVLYPTHLVCCNITGPSECGKSVFLTNLVLNSSNELDQIYIYSPSLHQDLYQQFFKCFCNNTLVYKIPKVLNEEDIDVVTDEIVNDKHFEISDTEIEMYESIEKFKDPQEYDGGGVLLYWTI